MYHLIETETLQPVCDDIGNPCVFPDIETTLAHLKELSAKTFKNYKPAILVNDSWIEREKSRFASGEYQTPFWVDYAFRQTTKFDIMTGRESMTFEMLHTDHAPADWLRIVIPDGHFLHVSKKDSAKIAFTENPQRGMQDRQTQQNVASYVQHYCKTDGNLACFISTQHAIRYTSPDFKIVTSADDIARIYAYGPASCMGGYDSLRGKRKDADYFQSCVHPVAVYGDSDFQLAYLTDESGNPTARTLIFEKHGQKHWLRCYGDADRLESALKKQGFTHSFDTSQLKIRKIYDENKYRFVLPYLDGTNRADSESDADFLILDCDGNLACNQSGLAEDAEPEPVAYCESCEDSIFEEDNCYTVHTGRYETATFCPYCVRNETFRCYETGQLTTNSDAIEIDGETYAEWDAPDYFYCQKLEINTTGYEIFDVFVLENLVESWCAVAVECHAFECRVDGKLYCNSLMATDSWADEPRAIFNTPDDMPDDADGFAYRCCNTNQGGLL